MLTRWSDLYDWPFANRTRSPSTFEQLRRQLDRVFAELEPELGDVPGVPRMTLSDAGEKLVLRAVLPGVSDKDLEITANATTLTVRGRCKDEVPEGYTVHRKERASVEFARSFQLPCRIDPDNVDAVMKDGILSLTLPKAAEARPKQISVSVN
jgi:HSP20 family protein